MSICVDQVRGDEQLENARCLGCAYPLRGLASDRCPECGRAFDRYDPWTIWLPARPNRLARWLMRRPSMIGRAFPLLAVLAAAWGSRIPGWSSPALHVAVVLLVACGLATLIWHTAIVSIHRRGYPDRGAATALRRYARTIRSAVLIFALLVILRPTMHACFWISRPWLDGVARDVLDRPFTQSTPYVGQMRGLYFIGDTRRCPHGVKLKLGREDGYRDSGPGFFFREGLPGECTRFEHGMPMGGGWYASD